MSSNNGIIKDSEKYVYELFDKYYQDNLVFHNLDHTKSVVRRGQEIAGQYDLDQNELTELLVAAWFHDTGHLMTEPANHEEKSVELMRAFVGPRVQDEGFLQKVASLIK
jgi:HD domain.